MVGCVLQCAIRLLHVKLRPIPFISLFGLIYRAPLQTPVCRRCAVPCVARLVRRLRNSHDPLRVHVLRQSSPTSPDQPALLGGAQGMKNKKQKQRHGELRPPCPEIKYDADPF